MEKKIFQEISLKIAHTLKNIVSQHSWGTPESCKKDEAYPQLLIIMSSGDSDEENWPQN